MHSRTGDHGNEKGESSWSSLEWTIWVDLTRTLLFIPRSFHERWVVFLCFEFRSRLPLHFFSDLIFFSLFSLIFYAATDCDCSLQPLEEPHYYSRNPAIIVSLHTWFSLFIFFVFKAKRYAVSPSGVKVVKHLSVFSRLTLYLYFLFPYSGCLYFCSFVFMKVLLDDAISSVELVNCQRMQVQVRGSVPSVAVDKTDGFLCYLGKDGMETTFVTSKVRACVRPAHWVVRPFFPFLLSSIVSSSGCLILHPVLSWSMFIFFYRQSGCCFLFVC